MTRRLLIVPVALFIADSAFGDDSIWSRRDPRYAYLFQDNKARRVGDLLTIIVSETTTNNEREQRALDKNNSTSATGSFSGSSASGGGGRTGSMDFSLSDAFRRQFSGNSQLTTDRRFTDRMAVTVVDIMPNGNLVIEGYRSRVVAGEERVLRVSGVVRPADIGIGNAVTSASIANLKMTYLGRGPESRTVNQGYGSRIGNLLWPW